MSNPYQSPRDPNLEGNSPEEATPLRSLWLIWLAIAWVGVMVVMMSFVTWATSSPAGTFFPLKVITTAFTGEAVWILCFLPKGWWRGVCVLLAILLAATQLEMWWNLP